jgi:hypothetical protein
MRASSAAKAGPATAASGGYTATWILLAHSGTFALEDRPLQMLRSEASLANTTGITFKCYRPPGNALTSVWAGPISGSTVTNFGMTLTVAHNAACTIPDNHDKSGMFDTIVKDLNLLDTLADVTYTQGGQVEINPIEDKTIFMHPMPTDSKSIDKDDKHTERDSRTAAALMENFPGVGLYLLEVRYTRTGRPVDVRELDPLLVPYILGRSCDIEKVTKKTITTHERPGIPLYPTKDKFGTTDNLFDTLAQNGLPEYYLDAKIISGRPSAKKRVRDFEIFRGGENSRAIQKIMLNNRAVMPGEWEKVIADYRIGVATKRITLRNLEKICKLLLPPGTLVCELFDIGCRDPYPRQELPFAVPDMSGFVGHDDTDDIDDDEIGSARSYANPNTPPAEPESKRRLPTFGPFQNHGYDLRYMHRRGGKKTKTRQRQGKRNKSLNVQNKSRFRRTRRRVIKRKNNKK